MKSVIDDYFGQGPKSDKRGVVPSTKVTPEKSEESHISAGTLKSTDEDVVVNGKENTMSKDKGCKTPVGKSKSASCNNPLKGRRSQKKKCAVTPKHFLQEDNLEQNTVLNCAETKDEIASPKSFAFKIRIKSKEQCLNDEDFSSPEQAVVASNMHTKELGSPQGTMFKYLVPQKNSSDPEKDCGSSSKVKVNISDFFSPAKDKKSDADHLKKSGDSVISSNNDIGKETKNAGDEKKAITPPSTSKLVKKTTKRSLSISKNRKNTKETSPLQVSDSNITVASSVQNVKSASKRKTKPTKKSLSLAKHEGKDEKSILEGPAKAQLEGKASSELNVSQSVTNAFKKIMSKSNEVNVIDVSQDLLSKKRKRGVDDDDWDGNLGCKPLKTVREDSPVRTTSKSCTLNQISCDSDDSTSSMSKAKSLKNISLNSGSGNKEEQNVASECTLKVEESKRNSLMSYFSKVSKEEVLSKEEKVEMKVKALIHSPPTTPSKKVKRRSVNSLPGGAASLGKKKPNLKNKLKESINAIDIIDNDEGTLSDMGKDNLSLPKDKKPSSPSSVKQKSLMHNASTSPKKFVLGQSVDLSNGKHGISPKTKKKSLSKNRVKKEAKNNGTGLNKSQKVTNVIDADEECLATPIANFSEEPEADVSKTTPNIQIPWTLKVCLTPLPLPTTQGTLLEEESDSDEIFLFRQDKKRKVEKQLETERLSSKNADPNSPNDKSSSPDIIFEKETDVKIASLFTRKADTQARQLFLQSGVPEQVKRTLETQRSFEEQEVEIFPKKSHIQQKDDEWTWSLPFVSIPLTLSHEEEIPLPSCKFSLKNFNGGYDILDEIDPIMSASCKGPGMRIRFGLPTDVVRPILRIIKQNSQNFVVVNTFKTLKKKFKEDDFFKAAALSAFSDVQKPKRKSANRKSLNSKLNTSLPVFRAHLWTEKYKPSTANEIVGNNGSVQQLKRWLEAWRKASEDCCNLAKQPIKEDMKRRKRKKDLLDDDDFLVSDNSSDGVNSNLPLSVAVLYGPNGNGKTSTVYALAKDLGYKVLEVNASEKRNGKLVLSKLAEATQSHQVQQGNSAEQGFAALFGKNLNPVKNKKSNKALKSNSDLEEEKAKKMSLILFEDIDIVFEEEDEGFLSAVTNLVSMSKRPVILTTTDPESPMVNRFMNSSSLILHFSCPPNLISSWLQIVSVVEGIYVAPETVQDLVYLCKGDFRRALLQMQLWVMSGANNLLMPSLPTLNHKAKKNSKHNDSDDISDNDDESTEFCPPSIPANTNCIAAMLSRSSSTETNAETAITSVEVPYPLDLGLFWWNLPPILSLKQVEHAQLPEKSKEDLSAPGHRRMLDDSFIASFCTDDGNTTDSYCTNDESDATCSQATSIGESGESQNDEKTPCNVDLTSIEPKSYKTCCSQEEMTAMLHQMHIISSIDVIAVSCRLLNASGVEPISRFSHPNLKDSLSLVKVEVEGPSYLMNSTAEDICHWLGEQSLNNTKSSFKLENLDRPVCYNSCLPNQEEHRWRDAHSETEQAALHALPMCMRLESRAISTDYLPALRTFCRLERNRSIINTKRRNRFYHYLKSLGAHLSELQLELLCHTMCDMS